MTATVARLPERAGVDPDNIRIGKDVIELLTSGMYVSPVTVYREYIQNATDAIDAARAKRLIGGNEYGRVAIDFDHSGRSVVIRDNGIGILPDKAADILLAHVDHARQAEAGGDGCCRHAVLACAGMLSANSPCCGMHTSLHTSHCAVSLMSSVLPAKAGLTVTGTGNSSLPS